jgi:hypothetical protein
VIVNADSASAAGSTKAYDFNGDGYVDLAVGVPSDGRLGAGAVNVLYGSRNGLTAKRAQLWSQASRGSKGVPAEAENFGDIITSGDFNCDRRADLAVGNHAKVAVLYGSRRGLTSRDQLIAGGLGAFDGSARQIEHLAAGDFDADGCSDLAVAGEGRVAVLHGSKRGLRAISTLTVPASIAEPGTWYQGLVAGDLTGDHIDDLVVSGVAPTPATDLGVAVVPGSVRGLLPAQARRYAAPARPEPTDRPFFSTYYGAGLAIGDFNGDDHADLAISDPGAGREMGFDDRDEPVPCPSYFLQCSGAIVVVSGSPSGLSAARAQLWTKTSLGRDHAYGLGLALAAGDVNADGRDDLAIAEYGAVNVAHGTPSGLSPVGLQRWTWDTPGVKGAQWDRDGHNGPFACGFVRILDHGRGPAADLAVGSEGYRTYTGAANVLYGSTAGVTATGDQLWRQSSRGVPGAARTGDEFGGTSTCYIDEG